MKHEVQVIQDNSCIMDLFLRHLEVIGFAILMMCRLGHSRQADNIDADINSTSTLDTNFRCADLLLGQYPFTQFKNEVKMQLMTRF